MKETQREQAVPSKPCVPPWRDLRGQAGCVLARWLPDSQTTSPSQPGVLAVPGAAAYQRAVRGSAGAGAVEQVWPGQEHLGRSL